MSVQYKPVLWDRSKWVYDAVLLGAVVAFLALYLRVAPGDADWAKPVDAQIQRMRAFGACAFLMLTVILCIGPLARLEPRLSPLLYNRRHFGVMTAVVAAAHAGFVLDWYFAFSDISRWGGLLGANTSYDRALGFPFEALGLASLVILAVLAATSHDFWMSFLTPPVWKALHMSVYLAYLAALAHILLGAYQSPTASGFPLVAAAGALVVTGLHLWVGLRERAADVATADETRGWARVGAIEEIADGRAKIVALPGGERVAVFRHAERKFSAISNVCAHQNGPLGEGRIIDGCVTCPWHGHQFDPEDGCAPAPFTDKVPTYQLKLEKGLLWVRTEPEPIGSRTPAVEIDAKVWAEIKGEPA